MVTKRKRDQQNWQQLQTCYVNLGRVDRNATNDGTEKEIFEQEGFTVIERGGVVFACAPTDKIKDGNRVCKEITIDGEGNVEVKFGGRAVCVEQLPVHVDRSNVANVRVLCGEVRELEVCVGFESEEEGCSLWEVIGGGEATSRRMSRTCRGAVPAGHVTGICQKVTFSYLVNFNENVIIALLHGTISMSIVFTLVMLLFSRALESGSK